MDSDFYVQPFVTAFAILMQNLSEILTVIILIMQGYYIYVKTRKEKDGD